MRKPTLHSTARKAEYLLLTAYCWAPCGIPQSLERLSYFQPALGLFWWIEFSELAPISYLDDKFTIVQDAKLQVMKDILFFQHVGRCVKNSHRDVVSQSFHMICPFDALGPRDIIPESNRYRRTVQLSPQELSQRI